MILSALELECRIYKLRPQYELNQSLCTLIVTRFLETGKQKVNITSTQEDYREIGALQDRVYPEVRRTPGSTGLTASKVKACSSGISACARGKLSASSVIVWP